MAFKKPPVQGLPESVTSFKPVRDLIGGGQYFNVNGVREDRTPIQEMDETYRALLAQLGALDMARCGIVNDDDTPVTQQQIEDHFEELIAAAQPEEEEPEPDPEP